MIAGCSNGGHDRRRRYVGVLRGFVSSYSQELVAGMRQRFLAESRPRQRGLETLRTFVTGWPPNCGGPGMPQRHDQFALTIRAIAHDRRKLVGEDPGECREVAGSVVGNAEQGADGGLPFGSGVQVTHVGHPLASIMGLPSIIADRDAQPHEPGRHVGRPRLLEVRQVDAAR